MSSHSARPGRDGIEVAITAGTGGGPTPIAAFDHILLNAGVANYNPLCLSSVLPPQQPRGAAELSGATRGIRTSLVRSARTFGNAHPWRVL